MGTFSIDIEIARGTRDVFAVVCDVRAMPRWYEAVKDVVELTPGVSGLGARYEIGRTLPGGAVRNEIAVTEYVADQLFTVESVSGPTPFRYRYTLEPLEQRTRLCLEGRITGDGLPGPLAHIDLLVTQLFKRGMGDNLREFSRLIEAS
ncbi:MAG TPA: SRPBCC family protein [Gemmatimonadaceae bacterium]|nr:SRPBCC family protein [Gemmatimonadaceae bacterium]